MLELLVPQVLLQAGYVVYKETLNVGICGVRPTLYGVLQNPDRAIPEQTLRP